MKQYPKKTFWKKNHKPDIFFLNALEQKDFYIKQGTFGLKCMKPCRLTFKQIEAGRKSIRRTISKKAGMRINTFTYASITKKAPGMRMGKGKGAHDEWVCPIRTGHIIYEVWNVSAYKACLALKKASSKLPVPCKIERLLY